VNSAQVKVVGLIWHATGCLNIELKVSPCVSGSAGQNYKLKITVNCFSYDFQRIPEICNHDIHFTKTDLVCYYPL
jgi:hypothetical protein